MKERVTPDCWVLMMSAKGKRAQQPVCREYIKRVQ